MAEGQNKHPNVYLIQPSKNLLKAHYSPGTVPEAGNVGDDDGKNNSSSGYHAECLPCAKLGYKHLNSFVPPNNSEMAPIVIYVFVIRKLR